MDNSNLTIKEQLKNLLFLIKILFRTNKKIFFIRLPLLFLQTISSILSIWFLKQILNVISGGADVGRVVFLAGWMAGSAFLVNTLAKIISAFDRREMVKTEYRLKLLLSETIIDLPYRYAVDPQTLDFLEMAKNESSFSTVLTAITSVLGAIITAATYAAVVVTVHPLILLLIAANAVIDVLLLRKKAKKEMEQEDEIFPVFRKLWALLNIVDKPKYGKELRSNRLKDWAIEKGREQNYRSLTIEKRGTRADAELTGLQEFANTVLNACIYLILSFLLLFRDLLIGDFTYALNCTLNLSGSIKGVISGWNELLNHGLFSRGFKYCMDLAEEHRKKTEKTITSEESFPQDMSIEFKNVTFTYPYSDTHALKNISFRIESGETLSLVGVNGSGKTTLVMLLCRFYEPDEGEILLGGIPIQNIPIMSYYKLLGIAFQDSQTFAGTVRENIVYTEEPSEQIQRSLNISALHEKIDSLPFKLDTVLGKNFDENGTDFSGGEKQKLAIARAVYADPPVMIFDEPTAALDPIAEYEIIHNLGQAAREKTAVFISHRLSSARTSDKIAVLANGELCEFGTHSDLIQKENGMYRELFNAQAQYYTE